MYMYSQYLMFYFIHFLRKKTRKNVVLFQRFMYNIMTKTCVSCNIVHAIHLYGQSYFILLVNKYPLKDTDLLKEAVKNKAAVVFEIIQMLSSCCMYKYLLCRI
jgi:hypothetical protein